MRSTILRSKHARRPKRTFRALVTVLLLLVSLFVAACEEKLPAKMALRPRGPLTFSNTGKSETIELAFFDDKGRPYVRKPTATFEGFDATVIDVTIDTEGTRATVKPKSSGTTDIVVTAFGLEQKLTVNVQLVGSVDIDPATPAKMKLNGKPHQLVIVVKDDRGTVIPDPKPNFKASDYCVDISPDGLITAQALGNCQVSVDVAGKIARHRITVVD
jgi:hypothetical protein